MNALVINMIAGHLDRLAALLERVRNAQIGAIYVLGNVVEPPAHATAQPQPGNPEQTYRAALTLLASLGAPIFVIPGEHDPSLATISRAAQASHGAATVNLVHRTAVPGPTAVVAGFGGRLTHEHEPSDAAVQFPAWEARVAMEHLHAYNDVFRRAQRRVLLFAVPPQATHIDRHNGERHGVALLNSLIRAYQPILVCCGGPARGRGVDVIDGTTVVNPGWLCQGSYALVDLSSVSVRLGHLIEPIALRDTFRSIVVALDGSPQAWRAFELAANMAKADDAQLTLVYAWEPSSASRRDPAFDDLVAQQIADGAALLADARRCVPDLAVDEEVLEGPAAAAIVRAAAAHHADLIAMGARGLGALRSAIGSVSQRVLHDAPCPVLIAREPPRSPMLLDLSAQAYTSSDWPRSG